MKKVKDICVINAGVFAQTFSAGEAIYIKGQHVSNNGILDTDIKPTVLWDQKIEQHFLRKNDVLVIAKGGSNKAAVFKDTKSPAIASSTFLVLKNIDQKIINSDYLAWYLNTELVQTKLAGNSKGTALTSINKNDIGNITIPIPSLAKQKLVLDLYAFEQKRNDIVRQLNELNAKKLQQQLLNSIMP